MVKQVRRIPHCAQNISTLLVDIINFHVDGVVQDTASEQMEELEEDLSPSQLMQNNHKFMLDKSNILLMGPTGSGVCCVMVCLYIVVCFCGTRGVYNE